MEAGEFLEQMLEHESFGQGICRHAGQGTIVELRPFAGHDVVVTYVAVAHLFHGNENSFSGHVSPSVHFVIVTLQLESVQVLLGGKGIERYCPFAVHYEIDFSDITLFLKDVSIYRIISKLTRHEPKCHMKSEILIIIPTRSEETLERCPLQNILKKELTHQMVLYLERDAVKVLFLLQKNGCAVMLPKVAEMCFNLTF